ncbi:DNA-cytosine methyltransferase [Ruminiclostridium papyrosolvens DSM 2782]|uniref:DNA (cytosine-5-)-methyltransferase n=1 Tax=Ruminiclostridium papyrosolvens DSM 2782 TaxID=588581 RepID=F1TIH8_9FIRM|nr:DNA cytosine methyltransferase [Ruminiclostridium papyrosolvens]EGD45795.1 DNA-cytosine methyltransferase [Ruminiclostridium papyrosolvens DSM 2782]WES33885.1 DNA cytosine methyltransferase [Ruminiclostridium papyrosolvens DSM 2782]
MNKAITVGSLFDGIGGFPMAGIRQGFIPVWASEIEAFPIAVTKLRFPQMLHVGDITKLKGETLPQVDVVCGGSPCQDLSVAGKRAGLKGERSGLFMEQIRIIKEMRKHSKASGRTNASVRPRYMVWENVPGAFSSERGEDFRAVLEEICRINDDAISVPRPPGGVWLSAGTILGYKFSVAWRVYDAQYWGLAQRRRRIYLVADFGGLTAPEILFKQGSLFGNPATGQKEGEGASACSQACFGASGRNKDIENEAMLETRREYKSFHINQRNEGIDLNGISGALLATQNMQMQTFIAEPMLCLNDQGGDRIDVSQDITATLRAGMAGHPPLVMSEQTALFENYSIDSRYTGPHRIAPTGTASYGTGGNNVPLINQPLAFSLDSVESNSMKSSNPYSGCRETALARTIDTTNPDPSKNQGGIAILQESYCIAGNIIDRQEHNGGNGMGCQSGISYTLNTADRHAVFCKHSNAFDSTYQQTVGALCRGDEKGIGNQYVNQDKCIVEQKKLIRRLTPLECERLMGFPDYWTDIPGASDSARYKALGNSVAIPCVENVLRGIAYFLKQNKENEE